MKTKKTHIWLVIMAIALLSVACSLPNFIGDQVKDILGNQIPDVEDVEQLAEQLPDVEEIRETIESEDIPEEAQEIVEQADEAIQGLITSITSNDTSMLDNYRTTFILDTEMINDAGTDMSQLIEMNEEINRTQGIYHNRIRTSGTGTDVIDSDMHIYLHGENTYIYDSSIPELPCIMVSGGMDEFDDIAFLRPEDFFDTIDTLDLLEKGVIVNGIKTDHYKVENTGVDMQETYEDSGDIWLAQEDGYIVRYIGFSDGEYDDGENIGEGRVEWEYNLFDVDQVSIIDLPVECRDQKETVDEVPVPENATNKEMIAGIITFESPDSPEKLGDYYREQLPAQGWKITEDNTISALVMMTAEKDGQSLQIMITPGESSGSSIIITTISLP